MPFTRKQRKIIKDQSRGKCDICGRGVGKKNLIAAHIIHQQGPGSDFANARAHCVRCEAEYHIRHVSKPGEIGLTRKENDAEAYGHWMSLDQLERTQLQIQYPEEVAYLQHEFEE